MILFKLITWNWEEREIARLGIFIRLEDPSEVPSLLRHVLSVPKADPRGLDVVGIEHFHGNLTVLFLVSIVKIRSVVNTLSKTLHKGGYRGNDCKNIGCH